MMRPEKGEREEGHEGIELVKLGKMRGFNIKAGYFESREEHFNLRATLVSKESLCRCAVGSNNCIILVSELHARESQRTAADVVGMREDLEFTAG